MHLESGSRRKFLKFGLLAGGAVAVTLTSFSHLLSSDNNLKKYDNHKLLILSADEANIFDSFAQTVIPTDNNFPSVEEAEVIVRLDEELYFISDNIASDIKSAINALEWLPVLYGNFSRFTQMDINQRLDFLNSTKNTKIDLVRTIVNSCRMICFNLYYGHESTWNVIGYDGPFSKIPEIQSKQREYYKKITKKSEQ